MTSFGCFGPHLLRKAASDDLSRLGNILLQQTTTVWWQVKEGKKPKFKLGVADAKLGAAVQDETSIPCVCNEFTGEVGGTDFRQCSSQMYR